MVEYVGRNHLISEFKSWITWVCFSHAFLCVNLHTMWSGNSLQLLCIVHFGIICLYAIMMKFVKILFALCMLVGIVV